MRWSVVLASLLAVACGPGSVATDGDSSRAIQAIQAIQAIHLWITVIYKKIAETIAESIADTRGVVRGHGRPTPRPDRGLV